MSGAVARLRAETRDRHAKLDDLPYTRSLLRGEVTLAAYGAFLQLMRAVHLHMAELPRPVAARLQRVRSSRSDPVAWLDHDLRELDTVPDLEAPFARATTPLRRALALASADSAAGLGMLYVVEGSRMGGLAQRRSLRAHPVLGPLSHRYLAADGGQTRAHFAATLEALDRELVAPEEVEVAVLSAQLSFEHVYEVLRCIPA